MAIKNVVIELDVEYLQTVAAERGVSRTKLVRAVMNKVIEKRLISEIIDDADLVETPTPRYRRFRNVAPR
jgi:hypothetical protein